jgi:hypothetical protein
MRLVPVQVPLTTRAKNAYVRFGTDEAESKRAWAELRRKAAAAGYEGDIWFHTLCRTRRGWLFIAVTGEGAGPTRYFATAVKVVHEPSTVPARSSRVDWQGARWRGIYSLAFRRCCGAYVPDGHAPACLGSGR